MIRRYQGVSADHQYKYGLLERSSRALLVLLVCCVSRRRDQLCKQKIPGACAPLPLGTAPYGIAQPPLGKILNMFKEYSDNSVFTHEFIYCELLLFNIYDKCSRETIRVHNPFFYAIFSVNAFNSLGTAVSAA